MIDIFKGGDGDRNKFSMHMPEGFEPKPHHAHIGPILAGIVMVLVLILGGLYIWGGMLAEEVVVEEPAILNNEPETPRAIADTQILETLSPSDELSAIEADLGSTNLESLETDLTAIEGELDLQVQ